MHPDLVAAQKCNVRVSSDIPADRLPRHAAASVNKAKTAVDETGTRMASKALEAGFNRALAEPVVSIEKDDLLASRGFKSGVARRGKPPVSLTDQTDTGIAGHHDVGMVRRAVIDDDDLVDRDRLADHTAARVVQEGCVIKARNDHRDGARPLKSCTGQSAIHLVSRLSSWAWPVIMRPRCFHSRMPKFHFISDFLPADIRGGEDT